MRPDDPRVTPRVIALDLEGTLIDTATSRTPRPGLRAFLDYCYATFERVVLFTAVPEALVREIVHALVEQEQAPPQLLRDLEIVDWEGWHKDLRYVADAQPEEVLLVDDVEAYVLPEQKAQWVPVAPFIPAHHAADQALEDLQQRIEERRQAGRS